MATKMRKFKVGDKVLWNMGAVYRGTVKRVYPNGEYGIKFYEVPAGQNLPKALIRHRILKLDPLYDPKVIAEATKDHSDYYTAITGE